MTAGGQRSGLPQCYVPCSASTCRAAMRIADAIENKCACIPVRPKAGIRGRSTEDKRRITPNSPRRKYRDTNRGHRSSR